MAAKRALSPRTLSPEIPVVSYPTPNLGDLLVVQDVDTRLPDYAPLEYGDLHPDQLTYPGLKLVFQSPLDLGSDYMWVRRVYAKDRQDEDAYNFAIKYSDNNPAYPIYVRTYTVLRAEYSPLLPGSADPVYPSALLVSEEVVRFKGEAEEGSLDSLYVKVLRIYETLPGPGVTRFETNEAGQTVEVTTQRKLQGPDYVPPTADAVTSFSSEVAEENVITDTVRKLPGVFPAKVFSREVPDVVPAKFRVAIPEVTEEETVAGQANTPAITLAAGELSKSEQQQTAFTKRTRKTTRSAVALPKTLTQKATTRVKQVATITETLQAQDTSEVPSAKQDIESEALGDGNFVVRKTSVPNVFNAKSEAQVKPDVVPPRFTAKLPQKTVTQIKEAPDIPGITLSQSDLRREEERLSEFEIRSTTVSRDNLFPSLNGIDYEESFDVQIPYTERISSTIPTGSAEGVPLDDTSYLIREYSPTAINGYLSGFLQTYPTSINMELPRILQSVDIEWDEKTSTGSYENTPNVGGILYSFENTDKGEASTSASATPLISLNFQDVWSKNIPATAMIFFLKNPVTEGQILSKIGAQRWPTFKPQSHVITGKAVELQSSVTVMSSINIQQPKPGDFGGYTDSSKQRDFKRSVTPITVSIPPCLHGPIIINQTKPVRASITATARTVGYGGIGSLTTTATADADDAAFVRGTLLATSPRDIPRSGTYLIESSVDFFKYGYSVVNATVIDASVFA